MGFGTELGPRFLDVLAKEAGPFPQSLSVELGNRPRRLQMLHLDHLNDYIWHAFGEILVLACHKSGHSFWALGLWGGLNN